MTLERTKKIAAASRAADIASINRVSFELHVPHAQHSGASRSDTRCIVSDTPAHSVCREVLHDAIQHARPRPAC